MFFSIKVTWALDSQTLEAIYDLAISLTVTPYLKSTVMLFLMLTRRNPSQHESQSEEVQGTGYKLAR